MFKLLLFAYVALCGILVAYSSPRKRSVDMESPSDEGVSLRKVETNQCNSCMINATPCGSLPTPQNIPVVQNIYPPTSISPSAFVWRCNLVPNKVLRDDYHHTPGIGAHKLHTRAKVWNDARKTCIEEGGYLAVINSQAEANLLVDLFKRSGPFKGTTNRNHAYVGTHDLFEEGDWVTVQGDSLEKTGYDIWTDRWDGQPDNSGGNQNCGSLLEDGKFDDIICDAAFAFFCEISVA